MEYNEFKKQIKSMGYKIKTYTYGGNLRFLEVLNHDKKFICGSGANCYTQEHINKHKDIFNFLNENRNKIKTDKNEELIF